MKAIVTVGGGNIELKDFDVPKPGPKDVLVKVVAAAQNPTDCKIKALPSIFCSHNTHLRGKASSSILLKEKLSGVIMQVLWKS